MSGPEEGGSRPSLSARTIGGLGWVYTSIAFHAFGQLTYAVIMSRVLPPRAFGVFAIASLVRAFAVQVSGLGIASALIQKRDLSQTDIRAGFTLSAVLGCVLFGILWALAPVVSVVFHTPAVVPVLRALGGVLVLSSLQTTSEALLRRDFRFRQTALAGITAFTVGYLALGIGSALAGAGVWSLVLAQYGAALTYLAITYSFARHPLRPTVHIASLHAIAGYGVRLTVVNILEFAGTNVDTYAVGRYSGVTPLGHYNRIFNLVVVPIQMLSAGLASVLFSGFSHIQHDIGRLKRGFVSSVSFNAAVLFPICAGVAVAGHDLVIALLGPKYSAGLDAVPYLALVAALSMTSLLYGVLCDSMAQLRPRILLQGAYLVILIGAMLAVSGGPLWRYAAAFAGCEVIRHVGYVMIARWLIGLRRHDLVSIYLRPILAAGVIAVCSLLVRAGLSAAGVRSAAVFLVTEVVIDAAVLILMTRFGPLTYVLRDARQRLAGSQSRLDIAMSSRLFRRLFGEVSYPGPGGSGN